MPEDEEDEDKEKKGEDFPWGCFICRRHSAPAQAHHARHIHLRHGCVHTYTYDERACAMTAAASLLTTDVSFCFSSVFKNAVVTKCKHYFCEQCAAGSSRPVLFFTTDAHATSKKDEAFGRGSPPLPAHRFGFE